MSWGIWGFETFKGGLLIKEDAGKDCLHSWSEACTQDDREGAPAPAGSAPPANELASITPQLVAIGLHFPYRASHTQGQRLEVQQ